METKNTEATNRLPFVCYKCNREFETINSFLTHMSRKYKLSSEQVYCEINDIKEQPLCKCGCGTKVEFHTFTDGYWTYKRGHAADGTNFTKETRERSAETYRNNLKSGKTIRKKKKKPIEPEREFKCIECVKSYDSIISLSVHYRKLHKKTAKDLYVGLYCNNLVPTCRCGCGEETNFLDITRGFTEYKVGHVSRIVNNYNTEESKQKSQETKRKMIAAGEFTPFVLKTTGHPWSYGLTKETDKRLLTKVFFENIIEEMTHDKSERMKDCWASGKIKPRKGSESNQWKGGISSINNFCRNNNRLYKEWKLPKLINSNFRCEQCGASGKLEVHHDQERFSEILRKVAKEYNWELSINGKLDLVDVDEEIIKLKTIISDAVAEYHVNNNVSGVVLCTSCHENLHDSYNLL